MEKERKKKYWKKTYGKITSAIIYSINGQIERHQWRKRETEMCSRVKRENKIEAINKETYISPFFYFEKGRYETIERKKYHKMETMTIRRRMNEVEKIWMIQKTSFHPNRQSRYPVSCGLEIRCTSSLFQAFFRHKWRF